MVRVKGGGGGVCLVLGDTHLGTGRVNLQGVGGRDGAVDKVGVEDGELVPLHHLRWRVVVVVVRLVVPGGAERAGQGRG